MSDKLIPKVVRVDDYVSMKGVSFTVYSVDRDNDKAVMTNNTDKTLKTVVLSWLTNAVNTFSDGVTAYIGKPIKWLPIPAGHVYYGFGYALPVKGGYTYDGPNGFDGRNLVLDSNGNPIPLRDSNADAYDLYMSNPAKHWRFNSGKQSLSLSLEVVLNSLRKVVDSFGEEDFPYETG